MTISARGAREPTSRASVGRGHWKRTERAAAWASPAPRRDLRPGYELMYLKDVPTADKETILVLLEQRTPVRSPQWTVAPNEAR